MRCPGEISFDELWQWVRGRRHPLDSRGDVRARRARELTIEPAAGASYSIELVSWNEVTLRWAIWQALGRAKVSTIDLAVCATTALYSAAA